MASSALPNQSVIHRFALPIDDRPHGIDLTGNILHAAVRRHGHVDIWYFARPASIQPMRRSFQIVATGQPLPIWLATHHQTAIAPDGQLVWHVLENHCTHPDVTIQAIGEYGRGGTCNECGVHLGDTGAGWSPSNL